MSVHYSESEIRRVIAEADKALANIPSNDSTEARMKRLQRQLTPVMMRFQMEEANRGAARTDIAEAFSDVAGYWVQSIARMSCGLTAPDDHVLHNIAIIMGAIHASAIERSRSKVILSAAAERGGHA